MLPSVTEVLPAVQISAGVATGLGFFFTYLTFQRIRKTDQIKLAEKINESLLNLDKELSGIEEGNEEALSLWDARRLNILEWYSFLVNEKQITDRKIQEHFEDAVIHDWEKYAADEEKSDPESYPELQKLYKRLVKRNLANIKKDGN